MGGRGGGRRSPPHSWSGDDTKVDGSGAHSSLGGGGSTSSQDSFEGKKVGGALVAQSVRRFEGRSGGGLNDEGNRLEGNSMVLDGVSPILTYQSKKKTQGTLSVSSISKDGENFSCVQEDSLVALGVDGRRSMFQETVVSDAGMGLDVQEMDCGASPDILGSSGGPIVRNRASSALKIGGSSSQPAVGMCQARILEEEKAVGVTSQFGENAKIRQIEKLRQKLNVSEFVRVNFIKFCAFPRSF